MRDSNRLVEYDGKLYSRVKCGGYILLRQVIDGKVDHSVSIPEHRLVYELATGVELSNNMVVHHLNRDRSDNRPSNIIALTRSDHAKLHSFEDRGDGATLIAGKVFPPYEEQDDANTFLPSFRGRIDEITKNLVVYGETIYLRKKQGEYYELLPIIDGKIRSSARIAEHRLVYELNHDVKLTPDMHVHHINHDKLDNRPENLQAMTVSEHSRLHALEDGKHIEKNYCIDCGAEISWKNKRCRPCHNAYQRVVNNRKECPSKDVLEEMIQTMTNCQIAKEFGVSDTAVKKWRKNYGLPSASEQHGWNRGRKPMRDQGKENLEDE